MPLFASGLLEGPPPRISPPSDVSGLLSGFLLSGPSESGGRDPDFGGDGALLVQIAVRDASVRAAVLREIDRRRSDDLLEDAETAARLDRLRDLLRRLDVPEAARPAESPPVAAEANAELLDRVLRASLLVRARGISRLRLTLEPPGLGEIRLELTLRGGVVRAAFQADDPGAAELLRSRLSELKAALEKRGLQVGELSVLAAEAGIPRAAPAASTPVPGNLDLKA